MIKFIIDIVTLLLCGAIIFFGGSKTVENSMSGFGEIKAEIEVALQDTPDVPDVDDEVVDDNEDNSGNTSDDSTGDNTGGNTGDNSNDNLNDNTGDSSDNNDEKPTSPTPDNTPDGDVSDDGTEEGDSTKKPEENPETPVTTTQTTETIKGMIDNYNPVVAETTKNMMSESIGNMIPESDNKDVITDTVDTYFDNLYSAIEEKKEETDNMEDVEEAEKAKTEFAEKESAALNGMLTIVGAASSGEVEEEKMTESVNAILDSTVCLETVTTTITEDEQTKESVKSATENMNEETKASIQETIQQKVDENKASENYDPDKEEQYKALADLFGIQLQGFEVPAEE